MLPSNPRPLPKGLPSNPHPRSRSIDRSREDNASYRSTAHQHHTTRSRSSSRLGRQAERSRTPPPLPKPHRERREYGKHRQATLSHKSDESTSSVTSFLVDPMKVGGGYASSRTSIEEDHQNTRPDESSKSLRQRRLPGEKAHTSQDSEGASSSGDGYAIWNRVANVASTLTVSVSKAWASQVTALSGEETPPGQESRLTRAMKAYHLEKARDPDSLPAWLFDETERREPVSLYGSEELQEQPQSASAAYRSRGLREIYDAYRPQTPVSLPSKRTYNNDGMPSKATDRLKALRDAKRNGIGSASKPASGEVVTNANQPDVKAQGNTPRPRVGLPSGPRRV